MEKKPESKVATCRLFVGAKYLNNIEQLQDCQLSTSSWLHDRNCVTAARYRCVHLQRGALDPLGGHSVKNGVAMMGGHIPQKSDKSKHRILMKYDIWLQIMIRYELGSVQHHYNLQIDAKSVELWGWELWLLSYYQHEFETAQQIDILGYLGIFWGRGGWLLGQLRLPYLLQGVQQVLCQWGGENRMPQKELCVTWLWVISSMLSWF